MTDILARTDLLVFCTLRFVASISAGAEMYGITFYLCDILISLLWIILNITLWNNNSVGQLEIYALKLLSVVSILIVIFLATVPRGDLPTSAPPFGEVCLNCQWHVYRMLWIGLYLVVMLYFLKAKTPNESLAIKPDV